MIQRGNIIERIESLPDVKAIIDFALKREDLREEIEKYLREIVAALPQSFKVK